eukprot:CAMPEP_0174707860 /NCGR_PEP_ID=MMETSP1094-20130205/10261_1 /TAXON_ID=156173 /ORGANISM="Chrysochromulina brevifilum, Strain UTEX LB 985" /LENGTH=196 /DNA_ID=CAMNT_0015906313 /DNA_START=210 /DNA_END=798 /DNA_ORIENTATION=-
MSLSISKAPLLLTLRPVIDACVSRPSDKAEHRAAAWNFELIGWNAQWIQWQVSQETAYIQKSSSCIEPTMDCGADVEDAGSAAGRVARQGVSLTASLRIVAARAREELRVALANVAAGPKSSGLASALQRQHSVRQARYVRCPQHHARSQPHWPSHVASAGGQPSPSQDHAPHVWAAGPALDYFPRYSSAWRVLGA